MRKTLATLKPPRSPWTLVLVFVLMAALAGAAATASFGEVRGGQPPIPSLLTPGSAREVRVNTVVLPTVGLEPVATMPSIPAGEYLLLAKARLYKHDETDAYKDFRCRLIAVENGASGNVLVADDDAGATAPVDFGASGYAEETLNLQTTAVLSIVGTAVISCGEGFAGESGPFTVADISIIAERLASLSREVTG